MRVKHLLKHLGWPALYVLVGWAVACPLSAHATTTNVDVTDVGSYNGAFVPDMVTINAGDRVIWVWTGVLDHTVTSDTGAWPDTGPRANPFTFTNTFNSAGSYPYWCEIHGFTGSVTVKAALVPPSVTITSPTNGATFAAPWTGKIQATVSDTNAAVTKVDFLAGATRLGTVTNPPANPSLTVTNLAAGNYKLTAAATDSRGATNTSASVTITVVTPAAIVLSSPKQVSASAFQFDFSANAGLSYEVRRSGALPVFSPIGTYTAISNTVNFLDNSATGAVNFYRIQLLPNP